MHLVFILYALFASLFVLLKDTLSYGDPFFIIGFRMAIAGIGMLVYQFIRKPNSLKLSSHSLFLIFLLALLHIYLTNIAEIWAAITLNAAGALGKFDQGVIDKDMKAKLSVFKTNSLDEIIYSWGRNFAISPQKALSLEAQ